MNVQELNLAQKYILNHTAYFGLFLFRKMFEWRQFVAKIWKAGGANDSVLQ